ncbi:MAG: glycoside hydrolase family 19 protein [Prevotella sp.]|nr:glycoside hydrolase family 19 protein [Prevotella sp.]
MEVTREQLLKIMPTAPNRVDKYLVFINRYASEFGITTSLRMSHYLAQIAHESAELKYTKELASGAKYDTGKLAVTLGNTPVADGDGQKYKGRGLIQLTGKANYKAYKEYCGFDVVASPELLEKPLGATRSSMWFWWKHGLNALADKDDVKAVTKRINGGYNGLTSRTKYLERAKKALGIS